MKTPRNPSRPERTQVIGALALIAVVVVIVLGIVWTQSLDEQRAREECAATLLEGETVEECMLVRY